MGPKKGSTNTKVEAANAKKAAAAASKNAKAQAQADANEAAEWSKGANNRGESKRQEEERKRAEAEAKKAELKRLQELEEHAMSKLENKAAIRQASAKAKKEEKKPWELALEPAVKKSNKGGRGASASAASNGKVTQAMIQAKKEAEAAAAAKIAADSAKGIKFDTTYGENRNRVAGVEGEARNLDAALDVLSLDDNDLVKHPEKRQKAAFKAYEEAMLPVMRSDYPGLKLSQYKERIFETWKKAPENPMNQAAAAYNAKK